MVAVFSLAGGGGQLLREMEKNTGGQAEHNSYQSHGVTSRTPKLSDIGISKMQSSRWQAEAGIPEEASVQAQIDQVKAAKKWIEEGFVPTGTKPQGGRPKEPATVRDISTFLGEKTWSRMTVSRLLQLGDLPEEVRADRGVQGRR